MFEPFPTHVLCLACVGGSPTLARIVVIARQSCVNNLSAYGARQESVVCEAMFVAWSAAPMLLLFQIHDLLYGIKLALRN
jgi:hypothetical protein